MLRALAGDRERRWPDVPAYLAALTEALGDHPAGCTPAPQAWIPVDPELTRPAARPSSTAGRAGLPADPAPPPRRRRPVLLGTLGALALVAGGLGGVAVHRLGPSEVTLTDDSGQLSVTVPEGWATSTSTAPWRPPDSGGELPALSAGSAQGWNEPGSTAEGVFLALLLGDHIPSRIPGHPECGTRLDPVEGTSRGLASTTVTYTDCPGVTVERVLQVADNRLLWVQVRSEDRATANRVLDGVATHGL